MAREALAADSPERSALVLDDSGSHHGVWSIHPDHEPVDGAATDGSDDALPQAAVDEYGYADDAATAGSVVGWQWLDPILPDVPLLNGRGEAISWAPDDDDDLADDDDEHEQLAPPAPAAPADRSPSRRRRLIGIAVVGGLAAVAVAGWAVSEALPTEHGTAHPSLIPATNPATGAAAPAAKPWCAPSTDPAVTITDGPGDQASGPGVIAAFEHSYYVSRDAAAARALINPARPTPAAADLRAGIAETPLSTKHCVSISATGPNTWAVTLTLSNGPVYPQQITTTESGGHTVIDTISKRGS